MRLGAIFAGGQARRFGSDKALALVDGAPLLAHVAVRLAPQVDHLVVVGRAWADLASVADRPEGRQGPLAALAGALAYARAHGYADVLTSGCDLPDLPADLGRQLGDGPAVVDGQPLLGLWPASLGPALDAYLAQTERRAMRGWVDAAGARAVTLDRPVSNINTPTELDAFLSGSAGPRSSR